jgi:uncharacterized protein YbjQ (UPF0145 family)
MPLSPQWVTTAFGFEGTRVRRHLGVVRGITVRSRNAMIGMRYDANEVAQGVTEVLAYGTAVVVEEEAR